MRTSPTNLTCYRTVPNWITLHHQSQPTSLEDLHVGFGHVHSSPKECAHFSRCPWFQTLIQGDVDFVKWSFGLKLNGAHSSPKERQLQKSCVSFGEECTGTS